MTTSATAVPASAPADERIVLQVVQPGLLGLMDGSVSTLAPLFATAELTGSTRSALFVGLAAALGAAISMGLAEALSDDGKVSGRGDRVHPLSLHAQPARAHSRAGDRGRSDRLLRRSVARAIRRGRVGRPPARHRDTWHGSSSKE